MELIIGNSTSQICSNGMLTNNKVRKPMKYSVKLIKPGIVQVTDFSKNIEREFDVREFVYGQWMYNEIVQMYPNYVHGEVWKLMDHNK